MIFRAFYRLLTFKLATNPVGWLYYSLRFCFCQELFNKKTDAVASVLCYRADNELDLGKKFSQHIIRQKQLCRTGRNSAGVVKPCFFADLQSSVQVKIVGYYPHRGIF